MKIKSFLSAMTALVLVVALAACGTSAPSSSAGSASTAPAAPAASTAPAAPSSSGNDTNVIKGESGITLNLIWRGDGQNKEKLDLAMRRFPEETGIGIEVTFVTGSWAEYFTKIQTMIAGGQPVDVVNVAIEGFEMIYSLGLAAPIDDWIVKNQAEYDAVVNDIAPNIMEFMNFGGKQYGVPGEWNNVVTHINTKFLEEAGLDIPPADWSKELFLEYAEKLTKDKPDGTKQYALYIPHQYFNFESWLYNNGTSYMSEDFTKSNLLDPAVVEMFQFAYDLIYTYGYAPIPEAGLDYQQMMVDGQVAMIFAGRWPTTRYVAANFSDVQVQYVPQWKSGTNVPIWGGTASFTMKDSKHFDEATKLSLFLSSAPFVEEWMTFGAIPVLETVAEKLVPSLGIPKNSEIYIESAPLAKAVQAPSQYAECANLFDRVFSDIMVNKQDIMATLTAADAEMNMILLDNKK